jgi:molybdopterin/thiamine biosynthesis adenylyltransferase
MTNWDKGWRVAVVGLGGIGNSVLHRLVRMPIVTLTLIDGDVVEEGNLERQPLFALADVGHFKVDVAYGWLRHVSRAELRSVKGFVDAANAEYLLKDHDIVMEGVDDLHAKNAIDAACTKLGIALVSGAVHQQQGQVLVTHVKGAGAELTRKDLFPGRPGLEQDGCDMRQVPLEVLEETGRAMVGRVRSIMLGEPVVNGRIEVYDGVKQSWMVIEPPR